MSEPNDLIMAQDQIKIETAVIYANQVATRRHWCEQARSRMLTKLRAMQLYSETVSRAELETMLFGKK
jgi:hypothetical protein